MLKVTKLGSDGVESISPLKGSVLSKRPMVKTAGLSRLCSPKLEVMNFLKVSASSPRDVEHRISTLCLFGVMVWSLY